MPYPAIGLILAILVSAGPVTANQVDGNGLAHRYALCSAWWDYEYEHAHGRLNNDLPKTLQSRSARDIAAMLSSSDTADQWIAAHLQALRSIEDGIMAAVYYQESRVDTYLCRKMIQAPETFLGGD